MDGVLTMPYWVTDYSNNDVDRRRSTDTSRSDNAPCRFLVQMKTMVHMNTSTLDSMFTISQDEKEAEWFG